MAGSNIHEHVWEEHSNVLSSNHLKHEVRASMLFREITVVQFEIYIRDP